jgi:mono/diheme cytochrome c family protein
VAKRWAVLALVLASSTSRAQDVELRAAPGRDLVVGKCAICHSLDYVAMNSPFLDRAGWERTVRKMIDTMGAPIDEKDVPAILDYLVQAYGR